MSDFGGNLPQKLISFRHLGFKSSAHKLPGDRESENPRDFGGVEEADTVEIGETSRSIAKGLVSSRDAPVRAGCMKTVM